MKKLFLILSIFLLSCGGSYQKPEAAMASDDSVYVMMNSMDSMTASYQKEIVLISIKIDSPIQKAETLSVQKDTTKKPVRKQLTETKLDTTSNLPMIRKNMEVINYQQKQLDSLLSKKKK